MRVLSAVTAALCFCACTLPVPGSGGPAPDGVDVGQYPSALRDPKAKINKSVVLISREKYPCEPKLPAPAAPRPADTLPESGHGRSLDRCVGTIVGPYTIAVSASCVYERVRMYVQLPWSMGVNNRLVFDVVEKDKVQYYKGETVAKEYLDKIKDVTTRFYRTDKLDPKGLEDVYKSETWADLATITLKRDLVDEGKGTIAELFVDDVKIDARKPFTQHVEIWGRRRIVKPADTSDGVTTYRQDQDGMKALKVSRTTTFPNYWVHSEPAPKRTAWVAPLVDKDDQGGPLYALCDDPAFAGVLSGLDVFSLTHCDAERRVFWTDIGLQALRQFLVDRAVADRMAATPRSTPGPAPKAIGGPLEPVPPQDEPFAPLDEEQERLDSFWGFDTATGPQTCTQP
jgi:hypothetical protein